MSARPFVPIVVSAVAFGLSIPLSKLLLKDIPPVSMAGLLYVGAFAGLTLYSGTQVILARRRRAGAGPRFDPLRASDLPWLTGAVVSGGVIGPICLMEDCAGHPAPRLRFCSTSRGLPPPSLPSSFFVSRPGEGRGRPWP